MRRFAPSTSSQCSALPFPARRSNKVCSARRAATGTQSSGSYGPSPGRVGQVSTAQQPTTDSRPLASSETIKEAQSAALLFLKGELQTIFTSGLTKDKYAASFTFQDPVAKYDLNNFSRSIGILRALFDISFVLHSSNVTGDDVITTRWTMELAPKLSPFVQKLVFTGRSVYTIDVLSQGKLTSQRDIWDAVQDNSYFSLEGLAFVLQQITSGQTSPNLESPKYTVLKKSKEYEIRRYAPYLTAEVDMPPTSKAAGGEGFNDLAGYIFGGNKRRSNMEMTTPVFTSAGQGSGGTMQFPIEGKEGEQPEDLPQPNDARVARTRQESAIVGVANLGGLPLNFQVTDTERRLRAALTFDKLNPEEGYKLARYNDPFTPLFLRRNEVLIRLQEYELEPAS